MKNFTFFSTILLSMFFICSCSSFEGDAKKQLEKTMLELAKDPDSYKFLEIETEYSTDSVVVLRFKSSGKNEYGGVVKSEKEYIYLRTSLDGTIYEAVRDLEKEPLVMEVAHSRYDNGKDNLKEGDNKEEYKAICIYLTCFYEVLANGREVKADDNTDKNNVENW